MILKTSGTSIVWWGHECFPHALSSLVRGKHRGCTLREIRPRRMKLISHVGWELRSYFFWFLKAEGIPELMNGLFNKSPLINKSETARKSKNRNLLKTQSIYMLFKWPWVLLTKPKTVNKFERNKSSKLIKSHWMGLTWNEQTAIENHWP